MITSLHSPHVERVKALLGSRGVKERKVESKFIAEGLQSIREAINFGDPKLDTLYLTESGRAKLEDENLLTSAILGKTVEVSDEVMRAMADTVTPQGILALCDISKHNFPNFISKQPLRIAYFWQIQDPGNAGAVIRTADAFGFNAIVFSDQCVDVYSPKVVRATAGSLWHIPVFEDVPISELKELAEKNGIQIFGTDGNSDLPLPEALLKLNKKPSIWVFGNEARGLPSEVSADLNLVTIPMEGRAESLNLAVAATVVMYEVSQATKL